MLTKYYRNKTFAEVNINHAVDIQKEMMNQKEFINNVWMLLQIISPAKTKATYI